MDKGVFKTEDGGDSWNAFNHGLPNNYISALNVVKGSPDLVFAGTAGSGVFAYTNVLLQEIYLPFVVRSP
jgi:hypothetical protein